MPPVPGCYDGAIAGLSMDDNMRKELCIEAFEQACRRQNAYGMLFHSDRGASMPVTVSEPHWPNTGQSRVCPAQAAVMITREWKASSPLLRKKSSAA